MHYRDRNLQEEDEDSEDEDSEDEDSEDKDSEDEDELSSWDQKTPESSSHARISFRKISSIRTGSLTQLKAVFKHCASKKEWMVFYDPSISYALCKV